MLAIVLLSGGLDSCVSLACALRNHRSVIALSFSYGQKHQIELTHAERIARHYGIRHKIIRFPGNLFAASSLVGDGEIPKGRTQDEISTSGIPSTYVPARNTVFLAHALSLAESEGAQEIYFGCNKQDRNGYPDCRPEFVEAFQHLISKATKVSTESHPPIIVTPLADLDKREIVELGAQLKAPIELTISCYSPNEKGEPCLTCDACCLREEAFNAVFGKR